MIAQKFKDGAWLPTRLMRASQLTKPVKRKNE